MPEEYISPYRQKLNKKKERAWKALAYRVYEETEDHPLKPEDWEPEGEFAVYMQRAKHLIKFLQSPAIKDALTAMLYEAEGHTPSEFAEDEDAADYGLAVHAVIDRLIGWHS